MGGGGHGTHPFAVHLTVQPVTLKGRSVFGSVCSHAILEAFSPLTLVLIPWRKMADIVDLPSQYYYTNFGNETLVCRVANCFNCMSHMTCMWNIVHTGMVPW